jgi:hypothetical protein
MVVSQPLALICVVEEVGEQCHRPNVDAYSPLGSGSDCIANDIFGGFSVCCKNKRGAQGRRALSFGSNKLSSFEHIAGRCRWFTALSCFHSGRIMQPFLFQIGAHASGMMRSDHVGRLRAC